MSRSLLLLLALCLAVLPVAAAAGPLMTSHPAAVAPNTTDPSVFLTAGPNEKLSTDLLALVEPAARLPGQTRETIAAGLRDKKAYRGAAATDSLSGAGEVYVYVLLADGSPTSLVDPFARVVSRDEEHGRVAAWVASGRLLELAAQPFVRSIRTVQPALVDAGSVTTEGDGLLKADLFRAQSGRSGAGMKVGVISDGVDHWTAARDTGDLPTDFHALSNAVGGDEGTAMAEIVYDIAPNASLYFHDCGNDRIQFNAAITELADAGCQVIVDDIYWLDDPYFEDGAIAQTIDSVVRTRNIVYVTSAGNRAQRHYQGPYADQGGSLAGWHDFRNGGSGVYKQLYVTIPNGAGVVVYLQWDDRFGSSGNNYDLYLATMDGSIVANSIYAQNGNDNPIESLDYQNPGSAQDFAIWVRKDTAAAAATLEVYMIPYSGAGVYNNNIVAADSIHGHKAATEAISVAAAGVTTPTVLEAYSSLGPVTIRWPAPQVRQKPEIAGPDGNLITGAGGFGSLQGGSYRFYGTSASCPHIAGLAALVWSGNSSATASQVRSALYATALDRGPAGFDYGWGNGWPDAVAFAARLGVGPAVTAVPPGTALPTDIDGDGKYEDVNGNGAKDFADIVLYFNQIKWIIANEPLAAFDYNGNGRIDFGDVVWLFNHL